MSLAALYIRRSQSRCSSGLSIVGVVEDAADARKYNKAAHYALIVSIAARELDIDLYTSIANQVGIPV